jgi:hypothetical protein
VRLLAASGISLTDTGTFPDVNESTVPNSQVRGEIEHLIGAGIIAGFPDGTFKPAESLTVAQAATLLVRTMAFIHARNQAAPDLHDQGPTSANYDYAVQQGLLDRSSADLHGAVYLSGASATVARGLLADMLAHALQELVDAGVVASRTTG